MSDKKVSAAQIITDYLRRNGLTKAHLARKLDESTSNLSQKFDRGDLNTGYVLRICEALDHDFFEDLSRAYKKASKIEATGTDNETETMADFIASAKALTKELIKQNNILLEQRNQAKSARTTVSKPSPLPQLNEPSFPLKPKNK